MRPAIDSIYYIDVRFDIFSVGIVVLNSDFYLNVAFMLIDINNAVLRFFVFVEFFNERLDTPFKIIVDFIDLFSPEIYQMKVQFWHKIRAFSDRFFDRVEFKSYS